MIKITGLSARKKVPLAWLGMVPEAITRHVGARLESVSLAGFCPSQLSGGQRQRVAIARAGPRRCWSTRPRSDSGGHPRHADVTETLRDQFGLSTTKWRWCGEPLTPSRRVRTAG